MKFSINLHRTFRSTLSAALLGALTLAPASFAELSSTGLHFASRAELGASKLTVTGPAGAVYEMTFAADEAPSFSLFDEAGYALEDGSYSYELRFALRNTDRRPEGADAFTSGKTSAENTVESGHFTVNGGSIVLPGATEATSQKAADGLAVAKAQVFATDLIVQGSECVGFDCSSSESFGSDTLRLKENNLRIHFDDTSASASFPGNDWRLSANDSTNGGANYFAIEDATANKTPFKVIAGAPTNSLYVDAAGKVGFGTGSPVVDTHVVSGNSPTLRLEQDGSDGFTAQTWDIAGNETNFFIRDVNNGSKLPFRIKPGSGTDNALYIDSDGDISLGDITPDAALEINDNTSDVNRSQLRLVNTDENGRISISFDGPGTGHEWAMSSRSDGTFVMTKAATGANELALDASGNLSIVGNFISNGMTLSVPDYVFEEDYPLMPMDQLATYLKEQKHLPNVPSAAEINAGSLNMTDFQLRLLEKIEELTLYTLQQQQEITELKAAVEAID